MLVVTVYESSQKMCFFLTKQSVERPNMISHVTCTLGFCEAIMRGVRAVLEQGRKTVLRYIIFACSI